MADFDTIYQEEDDAGGPLEEFLITVPDPVIIRGAGNVTM